MNEAYRSNLNRILIVGLPRSGTTWISNVLASTPDAILTTEPDNHLLRPAGLRAKRRLGRGIFPELSAAELAPEYERMWNEAAGAHAFGYSVSEQVRRAAAIALLRRVPEHELRQAFIAPPRVSHRVRLVEHLAVPERPRRRAHSVIVKSVYAPLSVGWIAERINPRVVVVLRDVRNIISSWVQLGWTGSRQNDELATSHPETLERLRLTFGLPHPPSGPPVARTAWLLASLNLALQVCSAEHPEWIVARHEQICADPSGEFEALAPRLGLTWTDEANALVARSNRPGHGFELNRIASELPEAWRKRLNRNEIAAIQDVLERFPLEKPA